MLIEKQIAELEISTCWKVQANGGSRGERDGAAIERQVRIALATTGNSEVLPFDLS